jgi:hypothetical protein
MTKKSGNTKSTTEVGSEELDAKFLPTYVNAPETVDAAVQRLLEVEMALEDLARAVEIAQITSNLSMLDTFRESALDVLKTKIEIVQPDFGELKLNVIVDDREKNATTG